MVSLFQRVLKVDPLLVGLGMVDCGAHGPNETFQIVQINMGILVHEALLEELGRVQG